MKRLSIGILFCIFLTACATQPKPTPAAQMTWPQHKNYLQNMSRWHTHGLMGVKQQGEATSATFDWRQCGKDYEIHLFGPFGAGGAVIVGNGHEVALTNSENQTFVARTPESLLKQQTNLNLPIGHLYYWLRGVPVPKLPVQMTFTPEHRLERMAQEGWLITYLNYDNIKGVDLPGKITIEYPNLRIKVVIDRWIMNAC